MNNTRETREHPVPGTSITSTTYNNSDLSREGKVEKISILKTDRHHFVYSAV